MADKGTIALLKTHLDTVLNNAKADKDITPQKHNNLLRDVIDTIFPTYGSVVGAGVYTVSMNITQVGLDDGKIYLLSFASSNTASATLDVDGLGTKALNKGANVTLVSSDIVVGKIYKVIYNSATDNFRINI